VLFLLATPGQLARAPGQPRATQGKTRARPGQGNRPLETEIIFRAHQKPRRKFAMAWVSYAWADAGLKQAKPCHVMHPVGLVHI
jgi:hypothetical protein